MPRIFAALSAARPGVVEAQRCETPSRLLQFKVDADTHDGDKVMVLVSGQRDALVNLNVQTGIELRTHPNIYPTWMCEPVRVPLPYGEKLLYRYVRVSKEGTHVFENCRVRVGEPDVGGRVNLFEDEFGSPEKGHIHQPGPFITRTEVESMITASIDKLRTEELLGKPSQGVGRTASSDRPDYERAGITSFFVSEEMVKLTHYTKDMARLDDKVDALDALVAEHDTKTMARLDKVEELVKAYVRNERSNRRELDDLRELVKQRHMDEKQDFQEYVENRLEKECESWNCDTKQEIKALQCSLDVKFNDLSSVMTSAQEQHRTTEGKLRALRREFDDVRERLRESCIANKCLASGGHQAEPMGSVTTQGASKVSTLVRPDLERPMITPGEDKLQPKEGRPPADAEPDQIGATGPPTITTTARSTTAVPDAPMVTVQRTAPRSTSRPPSQRPCATVLPDQTTSPWFTTPSHPEDEQSRAITMQVEREILASLNRGDTAVDKRKLMKKMPLKVHPDKGGTDNASLWLDKWKAAHLKWFLGDGYRDWLLEET